MNYTSIITKKLKIMLFLDFFLWNICIFFLGVKCQKPLNLNGIESVTISDMSCSKRAINYSFLFSANEK